jgi:Ca2+/Na+ antiporter
MSATEERKHPAAPEFRFQRPVAQPHASRVAWAEEWLAPALTFLAAFGLVVYLAMRGGGYDAVVRMQVGIAIWILIFIGTLAGVVPSRGWRRDTVGMLGLLGAFAAWTALSLIWTDSAERTMVEVVRMATYVGAFVLLLSLPGANRARCLVAGLATAIAVIGVVGLLSRLHPDWFGPNTLAESQPLARARLAYPLDAWNGLGTFLSIGFPLLLLAAVEARQTIVQALASAALPVLGLAIYLTYSRGGALATVAGLIVFFAVYQRRLYALIVGALPLIGAVVLILLTHHYDSLANGLDDATAHAQGDRVLAVTIAICALVVAARYGIDERWADRPAPWRLNRDSTLKVGVGLAVVAIVGAIAVGAPSKLANSWDEFKQPTISQGGAGRLSSASGNGRYQYWSGAIDAGKSAPLWGIGAGGFEFWWAQHATIPGYVRDAHSLYIETFGELGIIGLGMLGAFVVGLIAIGIRRSRALDPARAGPIAAATGGAVAFSVALAFDWGWEIAVVPIAWLILAAAILEPHDGAELDAAVSAPSPRRWLRWPAAAMAVPVLLILVTSYVGVTKVRASQDEFGRGDLEAGIADAKTAEDVQPYAATPLLQHALLLEQQGDLHGGVDLLLDATTKEPTNWRLWLTLSRLQVAIGEAKEAVASYERARSLNPESTLIPTADPRVTHPERYPQPKKTGSSD